MFGSVRLSKILVSISSKNSDGRVVSKLKTRFMSSKLLCTFYWLITEKLVSPFFAKSEHNIFTSHLLKTNSNFLSTFERKNCKQCGRQDSFALICY